ncbi:MAG TPA: hypothetical protein VJY63_06970 [Marinospirillum sp.]|uniref:hypothetical protein n=1 Tax=Marinospirillum sp. TaxID=2183934 RepID=UPI002B495B30|nr:hypothetical protein [Marinospirillum sp.]HKM15646.1 hypothetical protein [Marinospirillum sp.]
MTKLKQENKIKSLEEFVLETQQQLAEISLGFQANESASLITSIVEKVALYAFKIGYAGCADHIRENSSKNRVKMHVLDKLPNVNDTLNRLNEFLDFNVKNIFKDVINKEILNEQSSVKYFLLKASESSLNQTLTELTNINNKCLPNPTPEINIDFSKSNWNKVK